MTLTLRSNGYHNTAWLALAALMALSSPAAEPDPIDEAIAVLDKASDQVRRVILDNGMVCLIKEDHSAPAVSVQLWLGTGSIHENEYLGSGLSHAIEHMIFKGTETLSPGDLNTKISDAGGDVNAYTTLDRTVFHADLPSKSWRVGLDILADSLMHATFPEKEWKKEKQVILREFAMGKDDPGRVIDKLIWNTAFTVHPYRVPTIGYEELFKKLTHTDLALFARRNYVPDNLITIVVGDIRADEVEAGIREAFKGFERRARAPLVLPAEPEQIAPRLTRKTGAYKVSRLEWAYPTVPLSHADTPALDLLSEVVGNGTSSRINMNLKERQRLVFEIGTASYTLREAGVFDISVTFDPLKEAQVLDAIEQEVATWRDGRFTPEELDKAKRTVLVNELAELQTMRGQATAYAIGEFYVNNPAFSQTYLRQLQSITPDMLRDVARRYLQPTRRSLVILAPASATNAPVATNVTATVPMQKIVLTSGATLLVREDHRLPFVYFCAALRGGLLSETDRNNGITRLMSGLLLRGTAKRTFEEITAAYESRGGMLASYSGYNGFGLQARCLAPDAELFMGLIADSLLNPVFKEEEIAKQKRVQAAQIAQEQERPTTIAQESMREILFPNHPYRWNPLGRSETLQALTRDDLAKHHERHVVSSNLVIAIFGDVDVAHATALAEKHLAGLRPGPSPLQVHEKAAPSLPARTKRRLPKEQAVVLLGFPGVDVNDPRSDALTLLETSMSGLSSDLGKSIREDRGLVYYVGAYQQTGYEPGAFAFYAGTREESVPEVERLILKEAKRVATKGLRPEEIERARFQLVTEFEMGLQDMLNTAMRAALEELYGLGYEHAFNVKERLDAVTPEAIQRAAASILDVDKAAVSIVLPGGSDEPAQPNPK